MKEANRNTTDSTNKNKFTSVAFGEQKIIPNQISDNRLEAAWKGLKKCG